MVRGGARSRSKRAPPQRPLCCEAPPFVCHLFTLLAWTPVAWTMKGLDQQLFQWRRLLDPLSYEHGSPQREREKGRGREKERRRGD